jgi:hypothetical protein
MNKSRTAAACGVSVAAFILYRATLLPGVDFGDTGSLQTIVGSPIIEPRDGYPLYFALGALFLGVIRGDPAHVLNLASAFWGAAACGIFSLVACELSGSLVAGVGSAILFAGSYTFWSQSVIAEVYTLHIFFVLLTVWLLLLWERNTSLRGLGLFFAAYAFGFGNHLSMILLFPGYVLFLFTAAPGGWRSMMSPRVVALAVSLALLGALQYAWNLRTLWVVGPPLAGLTELVRTAWFDVTKSDWRETMVMNVPASLLANHASMYLFDLKQQFGWLGAALAMIGFARLLALHWRRGLLLAVAYLTNVSFAYGYNVGDAHVFFLPSHAILALLTAPGAVFGGEVLRRLWHVTSRRPPLRAGPAPSSPVPAVSAAALTAVLLLAYAAARIYRDFPALDRSEDRRPSELLNQLTAGLDDRQAVLLTDLDWQVQNGLSYYEKVIRPELATVRLRDVLLYAPALVQDNLEIGRRVALTAQARLALADAYGPLIRTAPDPQVTSPTMLEITRGLASGTPYVLCVLRPTRGFILDRDDLRRAISALTGNRFDSVPNDDYVAIAGTVGDRPTLVAAAPEPFRQRTELSGVPVEIRMESWLAADTIRRMGFGHVIARREHSLIVERGVSFVAFDTMGRPIRSGYSSSIFAPQARYLCYR